MRIKQAVSMITGPVNYIHLVTVETITPGYPANPLTLLAFSPETSPSNPVVKIRHSSKAFSVLHTYDMPEVKPALPEFKGNRYTRAINNMDQRGPIKYHRSKHIQHEYILKPMPMPLNPNFTQENRLPNTPLDDVGNCG